MRLTPPDRASGPGAHDPVRVDANGHGPAVGIDVDHVECLCAPGRAWPCTNAIADLIRARPGITSDELEATFRAADNLYLDRRNLLETAHRTGRAHGFGQLLDGTWWSAADHAVIAACVTNDRPGPGTEIFWAYRRGLLSTLPIEIKDWGHRHG